MINNRNARQINTNQSIAFLIEGFKLLENKSKSANTIHFKKDFNVNFAQRKRRNLPERATLKLARLNNCKVFDSITGGSLLSEKVFFHLFKNADELKQKFLVSLFIQLEDIYFRGSFTDEHELSDYLYDEFIKPRFEKALDLGVIKTIPEWILDIKKISTQHFKENTFNEVELKINPNIGDAIDALFQEEMAIANHFSFSKLVTFLKNNPQIEIVYGLIGQAHLEIAHYFNHIFCRNEYNDCGYVHGLVQMGENRKVELHLFGGRHEQMEHYELLKNYIKNRTALILPPDNSLLNAHFCLFMPDNFTFLKDQQLLKKAKEMLDDQYPEKEAIEKSYVDILNFRKKFLADLAQCENRCLNRDEREALTDFIQESEESKAFYETGMTKIKI